MTLLLNNIKKIEYIELGGLADILLLHNDRVLLRYWRNFTEHRLTSLASINVTETIENGTRYSNIKLTAHSPCPFTVGNRKLAWRVTTVLGDQYLIGINEMPCPVTLVEQDFPSLPTEQAGYTITVTWKTPLNMLLIIG